VRLEQEPLTGDREHTTNCLHTTPMQVVRQLFPHLVLSLRPVVQDYDLRFGNLEQSR